MSRHQDHSTSDDFVKQFRDKVFCDRNMYFDQFPQWSRRPFGDGSSFDYPSQFHGHEGEGDIPRSQFKPRTRHFSNELHSDFVNPCYSDGTFKDRDSIPIKVIHEKTDKSQSNTDKDVPCGNINPSKKEDLRHIRSTSAPPQQEIKGVKRDNSCPNASISSFSGDKDPTVHLIPVQVIKSQNVLDENPLRAEHLCDSSNKSSPASGDKTLTNDPLTELLTSVHDEVSKLVSEVDAKPKTVKEILYLDEMLTRQMLRLDNIEAGDRVDVRTTRKSIVKFIQSALDRLDVMKTEISSDSKKINEQQKDSAPPENEALGNEDPMPSGTIEEAKDVEMTATTEGTLDVNSQESCSTEDAIPVSNNQDKEELVKSEETIISDTINESKEFDEIARANDPPLQNE